MDSFPERADPIERPECSQEYWETLGQRWVVFHASPNRGQQVLLELEVPRNRLVLCAMETRGAWLRVATADYVHVNRGWVAGWVARSQLRKIEGTVGFTGGSSRGRNLGKGHGHMRVAGPGVRQGPAKLVAGTPVFATRGGGTPWAKVRDDSAIVEAVTWKGRDWARIVSAPRLGFLSHAWVRRSAVRY